MRGLPAVRSCIGLVLAIAALFIGAPQAMAATTVYPTSVFSSTGGTQSNNLIGNNPSTARYSRNQQAVLNFGAVDISGYGLTLTITSVTNATTYIWARFGRITGGVFTSANGVGLTAPNGSATPNAYALVTGAGPLWISGGAFKSACQALGGCNAVVFGNSTFSATGSQFFISAIGATPEPATWMLMMLAFAAVALRMKAQRRAIASRMPAANAGRVSSRAPMMTTRSPGLAS
jgi:hypothetical protein